MVIDFLHGQKLKKLGDREQNQNTENYFASLDWNRLYALYIAVTFFFLILQMFLMYIKKTLSEWKVD